ncbi:MAG: hypothetical protein HOO91_20975 [Bacteroidales bacterium]|nr:hypothetical protein [Bacteroidales bacterium]
MKNSELNKKTKCFSCQAETPDIEGPVHRYMVSSPGCWKLFGEILELEYSNPEYMVNHRITVDAFAVQHYGKPSPQAIHSVNLHLASMYLIYGRGFDVKLADKGLTTLAKYKSELFWLDPPENVGEITVADILKVQTADEHCKLVFDWGNSVWKAWSNHQNTVKEFVERHIKEIYE